MENLREATPEETATTLAFALRFEGKRRLRDAEEMMARITAERLIKHLKLSVFVLMKKPGTPAHSLSHYQGKPENS